MKDAREIMQQRFKRKISILLNISKNNKVLADNQEFILQIKKNYLPIKYMFIQQRER